MSSESDDIAPRGGEVHPNLLKERKELAGRYYQLLSRHAAIRAYLPRIEKITRAERWWCRSRKRQSRQHLFFRCRRWAPKSRKLWKCVGEVWVGTSNSPTAFPE